MQMPYHRKLSRVADRHAGHRLDVHGGLYLGSGLVESGVLTFSGKRERFLVAVGIGSVFHREAGEWSELGRPAAGWLEALVLTLLPRRCCLRGCLMKGSFRGEFKERGVYRRAYKANKGVVKVEPRCVLCRRNLDDDVVRRRQRVQHAGLAIEQACRLMGVSTPYRWACNNTYSLAKWPSIPSWGSGPEKSQGPPRGQSDPNFQIPE